MTEEQKIDDKKKAYMEKRKKQLEAEQKEAIAVNQDLNELKQMRADLDNEIQNIEETIKDTVKKRREIKKVRRAFLKRKSGWIFRKEAPVEELQEYVVLLMKNNGHTDLIEGVQAGEFYLKSASGKEEKSVMLTANKLTTINYNNQYFKGWIVHEDNVSPYPQDPLHNAETFRKTTQKLALNYRDVNESKFLEAKTRQIVTFIIIGIVVIYIIYIMGKNAGWFGAKAVAETAVNAVKENLTNQATGVVVG